VDLFGFEQGSYHLWVGSWLEHMVGLVLAVKGYRNL
jgi:hypothetical protein